MVPFQEMQHHDAESALEPVIFLLAHVVDLLGDRCGIDFREPAGAQKLGLTPGPRIKIGLFRGSPFVSWTTFRAIALS